MWYLFFLLTFLFMKNINLRVSFKSIFPNTSHNKNIIFLLEKKGKLKIRDTTIDHWRIHVKEELYRMDPPFSRWTNYLYYLLIFCENQAWERNSDLKLQLILNSRKKRMWVRNNKLYYSHWLTVNLHPNK